MSGLEEKFNLGLRPHSHPHPAPTAQLPGPTAALIDLGGQEESTAGCPDPEVTMGEGGKGTDFQPSASKLGHLYTKAFWFAIVLRFFFP